MADDYQLCQMIINGDPDYDDDTGCRVLTDPVYCANDAVGQFEIEDAIGQTIECWLCEEHAPDPNPDSPPDDAQEVI